MTKLRWGMIGGGEDSQIGFAHRMAAAVDGRFEFVAGALDIDPDRGRNFAQRLGIGPERAYADWREMLAGESAREDKIDLVTVATPNASHFEISKAFLDSGFHVLCEKPLTTTLAQARELIELSRRRQRLCAVNYGYSGYPLVRQIRAMVKHGDLGRIRVIVAEFAGGFFADAATVDNPRVRWRFDPGQAGVSAITADAGIHALHMACFVADQRISSLSADFAHGIESRQLEDDALIAFRMSGGIIGRLWASGLAIGRTHGLTLQVYGEQGGLRWQQEQPNQLYWTPLGAATQILERGASGLYPEAQRASRLTVGHAEGMPLAFANIYRDLADNIEADKAGISPDPLAADYPGAEAGLHSLEVIFAAAESAAKGSRWQEI